jgi:hypothetical protein
MSTPYYAKIVQRLCANVDEFATTADKGGNVIIPARYLTSMTKMIREYQERVGALEKTIEDLNAMLHTPTPPEPLEVKRAWDAWRYETAKRLGTLCSVCRTPQVESPGGTVCQNGHGGADPMSTEEVPAGFIGDRWK